MSIPGIKELLRSNDQIVSGTKSEIIVRVLDCIKNGNLPRCPVCYGGRLKKIGSNYRCPGFHDDEHYRPCGYSTKSIIRPPWHFSDKMLV